MKAWIASGLGVVVFAPALVMAGPGTPPPRGTRTASVGAVRTSTVASSALDRELAKYLVLLESWDDVKDLELLELLPVLEDEDE
jgi:hypothetical protein